MNILIDLIRGFRHALAALTSNCAHFRREWQNSEACDETAGLSGRWEGHWVSDVNGHRGGLRCVLTRVTGQSYRACFHATYAKVLRVCYCIDFTGVEENDGRFCFRGESDLGRLAGGIYRYDGKSDGSEMIVNFRCRYDHGVFRLHR